MEALECFYRWGSGSRSDPQIRSTHAARIFCQDRNLGRQGRASAGGRPWLRATTRWRPPPRHARRLDDFDGTYESESETATPRACGWTSPSVPVAWPEWSQQLSIIASCRLATATAGWSPATTDGESPGRGSRAARSLTPGRQRASRYVVRVRTRSRLGWRSVRPRRECDADVAGRRLARNEQPAYVSVVPGRIARVKPVRTPTTAAHAALTPGRGFQRGHADMDAARARTWVPKSPRAATARREIMSEPTATSR